MKFIVEGMTCGHCERAIQHAVARLSGTARVDLVAGTVELTGIEDAAAVRSAIEEEGYRVIDDAPAPRSGGCCMSGAA